MVEFGQGRWLLGVGRAHTHFRFVNVHWKSSGLEVFESNPDEGNLNATARGSRFRSAFRP